jgi:hypothetical protein
VIDRSAMHVEPWEALGAETEAGLIAARQRRRTDPFDAIDVGEDAANAG